MTLATKIADELAIDSRSALGGNFVAAIWRSPVTRLAERGSCAREEFNQAFKVVHAASSFVVHSKLNPGFILLLTSKSNKRIHLSRAYSPPLSIISS